MREGERKKRDFVHGKFARENRALTSLRFNAFRYSSGIRAGALYLSLEIIIKFIAGAGYADADVAFA